ncbi:phage tail assembly chaperone [Caproicibacterium sp. XB1]|uniref:phage tail assembly chaperone n=1 Tax=Caproicibacterium sp. XB1 TaxID=3396405 RepID=UPI0039B6F12B
MKAIIEESDEETTVQATSLSAFFKENAQPLGVKKYVASERFVNPSTGEPMEWTLKPISSDRISRLRESYTRMVKLPGKKSGFSMQPDQEAFAEALAAECTVFPDLHDAQLQDSYGVKNECDLLHKLLYFGGEYDNYVAEVMKVNHYADMEDLVNEAKN